MRAILVFEKQTENLGISQKPKFPVIRNPDFLGFGPEHYLSLSNLGSSQGLKPGPDIRWPKFRVQNLDAQLYYDIILSHIYHFFFYAFFYNVF